MVLPWQKRAEGDKGDIMRKIGRYAMPMLAAATTAVLLYASQPVRAGETTEAVEVPEHVIELSEQLGQEYGICPELLQAICWRESRFQAEARNGGCIGIMQVSKRWHVDRMDKLGVSNLTDPAQNMEVAADYLRELFQKYHDAGIVLMVYNGDSRVWKILEGQGEISGYAREILELSERLERQHGK